MPQPWYRQVSKSQWKAFLTTFAAWVLDAFDFTILTFVLVDIQQSFSVNKGLAGLLGTVTLLFRVVGGIGAGTFADRYGRKGPILFSIAWYTLFAFLSGASTTYVMLFAFRGLFGIGMGGMWAAGMPLALEHWPQHLRGIASGFLQGGYSLGFLLSSLVYQLGYPYISHQPEWAWRIMLWSGVVPAAIIFFVMRTVPESPILARAAQGAAGQRQQRAALARPALRPRPHLGHAAHVVADGRVRVGLPVHDLLVSHAAVDVEAAAAEVPAAAERRRADRRRRARRDVRTLGGRRGSATLGMVVGLLSVPLYLFATNPSVLLLGAWMMGFFAAGAWGMVPGYLSERFPTEARGVGTGFAYHAGVGIGSYAPFLIGRLQDGGTDLRVAMAYCIVTAGVACVALLWLGPETRGRTLT